MSSATLLPVNATASERALEAVTTRATAVPNPVRQIWDPWACPIEALPWLAWAMSVDTWDNEWPEETKRAVVAGSLSWHRKKGTPWAVKQALANIGYPIIHLVEYRTYFEEWVAAGGRTLDGSWGLGDDITLDPPAGAGADIRKMQLSHWAEYAIRINVEGPWNREQQRAIRSTAQAYAPERSHLRSIITSGIVHFDARIKLTEARHRGRIRFDNCKRAPVHRWRTLDGCWKLATGYAPRRLNGAWDLAGDIKLIGTRPVGPKLDSAFSTITTKTRSVLPIQGAGGDRLTDPGLLAPPTKLDGTHALNGRKTSGHWNTDGTWALDYPTLATFGMRRLDGTWNLGRTEGLPGVWFTGIATTRRGGVVTKEVI